MSMLVSFQPDGNFITLTTVSRRYGKSQRFLLLREALFAFINFDAPVLYDADLNSFLRGYYISGDTVTFRITWLTGSEFVSGRVETFDLPVSVLKAVLQEQAVKHLVDQSVMQCRIILKPSAQRLIRQLNRLERRALSKALRDNFHWSREETITLYEEWNNNFYFQTETICGGLCQHTDTIIGKDGKPRQRVRYSVHT